MENDISQESPREVPETPKMLSGWAYLNRYIRVFPVTSLITFISAMLFILVNIFSYREGEVFAYLRFGAVISEIGQILLWQGEIWRLAVNPYHHGGFLHIFFNLYALYYFGSFAEKFMGKWRYLAFVFICGTFQDTVCQITIEPGAIGISGIVFGLFGFLWIVREQDARIKAFLSNDLVKIMLIQLFIFIPLTLLKVINIANVGHFFGLIYGILFAFAFYRKPNRLKKTAFILFNLLIFPAIYQAYHPVNNPAWQEWHRMGEPTLQELIEREK
jgi:rhomboid protease GluP